MPTKSSTKAADPMALAVSRYDISLDPPAGRKMVRLITATDVPVR